MGITPEDIERDVRSFYAQLIDTAWLAICNTAGPAVLRGYIQSAKEAGLPKPLGCVFYDHEGDTKFGLWFPNINDEDAAKYLYATQPGLFMTRKYVFSTTGGVMGVKEWEVKPAWPDPPLKPLRSCMLVTRCINEPRLDTFIESLDIPGHSIGEILGGAVDLTSAQEKKIRSFRDEGVLRSYAVWPHGKKLRSQEEVK